MSEADVRQEFPNAQRIGMVMFHGQFTGTCYVVFPTVAEAEETLRRTGVAINGHAVQISMAGVQPVFFIPPPMGGQLLVFLLSYLYSLL